MCLHVYGFMVLTVVWALLPVASFLKYQTMCANVLYKFTMCLTYVAQLFYNLFTMFADFSAIYYQPPDAIHNRKPIIISAASDRIIKTKNKNVQAPHHRALAVMYGVPPHNCQNIV